MLGKILAKRPDFKGTLTKSGLTMGQIIRVFAWGHYRNDGTQNQFARVRLFYNATVPAAIGGGALCDTGANVS